MDWFGETEDNRTGLETAADMAYTGIINAFTGPILSKIWRSAKFVQGKVRLPKDGLNKTNKEVLDAFNSVAKGGDPTSEVMANPTVGMVTGSPLANMVEGGLEMMPTSTKIMRKAADDVIDQMTKENQRLAMEYGGIRSFDETADLLLTSAQRVRDDYTKKVSGLYNDIGARIPEGTVSDGKSTANFIQQYIDEAGTATGKDYVNKALFQAQKVVDDAANGKLTYQRLKQFRSDTMKGIRSAESQGALGPEDANVKKLIGHLTKDLYSLVDNAAIKMGDSKLLDDYKVINNLVKDNNAIGSDMAFINNVLKRGEADTSAALRYAFAGAKDSGKRIRKLRNQFTQEEFDVLSEQVNKLVRENEKLQSTVKVLDSKVSVTESTVHDLEGQKEQLLEEVENLEAASEEKFVSSERAIVASSADKEINEERAHYSNEFLNDEVMKFMPFSSQS